MIKEPEQVWQRESKERLRKGKEEEWAVVRGLVPATKFLNGFECRF